MSRVQNAPAERHARPELPPLPALLVLPPLLEPPAPPRLDVAPSPAALLLSPASVVCCPPLAPVSAPAPPSPPSPGATLELSPPHATHQKGAKQSAVTSRDAVIVPTYHDFRPRLSPFWAAKTPPELQKLTCRSRAAMYEQGLLCRLLTAAARVELETL